MFLFLIQGFSLVANLVVFPQNVRCCFFLLLFLEVSVFLRMFALFTCVFVLQHSVDLFCYFAGAIVICNQAKQFFRRPDSPKLFWSFERSKRKKKQQQANKITEYWFGWLLVSTHGRDNHQHSNSNLRPISSHTSRQSYRQP